MDAFKDIWNSLRLSVIDRLGNPLLGSFCIAWAAWNFRILVIVLGSGDWKPKLDYIDKVLMKSQIDWLVHGYLIPLAFAIAWVFILPYIFRRVLVFHREQAATTAKAVMIAEGKQPIGAEEANKLRLKIREAGEAWENERAVYLKQIDEMSERIAKLQAGTAQPTSSNVDEDDSSDSRRHEAEEPADSAADALVASIADAKIDGKPLWPRALGEGDLEQLPPSVSIKVKGHRFEQGEVQALLAMRNWSKIDHKTLARTLNVEEFDAKVILDRLRELKLLAQGTTGTFMTPEGRMLTAYFKRVFMPSPPASPSPSTTPNPSLERTATG